MKVKRADVARLAGVSTATVSNVLSNPHKVKDETARKVLHVVRELGYRPDMIARSLNTRKTMQIGIVMENIHNPYYGEIVEYFESKANDYGYFVNICTAAKNIDDYLENFITRGLDGAFVASLPYPFMPNKLYALLEHNIKLVVSGKTDHPGISAIENDYDSAMQDVIARLAQMGHEDIAYLSGLGREIYFDQRISAYLETMTRMGNAQAGALLVDGSSPYPTDMGAGYRQAVKLMESGKRFTAVICGNDLMAIGAIRAFAEKGLHVPNDVSVVGFDGIALGRFLAPSIATMAVNAKTFGEKAFDLLLYDMREGETGFFKNALEWVDGETVARRK